MEKERHVKVAIVGGGPAGIGAALGLVRRGVKSIVLIERDEKIGGIPALYKRKPGGVPTFIRWSADLHPVDKGRAYCLW